MRCFSSDCRDLVYWTEVRPALPRGFSDCAAEAKKFREHRRKYGSRDQPHRQANDQRIQDRFAGVSVEGCDRQRWSRVWRSHPMRDGKAGKHRQAEA